MMNKAIIQTHNLSKTYTTGGKPTAALENLNLEVQAGEIFGYLGPNGAGKTTTIRLLLDLIRPTAGKASIFGLDSRADSVQINGRIGFLPGELSLWRNWKARDVLKYVADVRGNAKEQLKEADRLAEMLKFDMSKQVRDYSTGNKRKLGLIIAMMHKPELLILDEPTSGLDPLMQQTFNHLMRDLRAEGRTVFLSSHVLSEVQAICDRVGILRDGRLRAIESIERLTRVEFRQVEMTFRAVPPASIHGRLDSVSGVSDVRLHDNVLTVRLYGDFDPLLRAVSDNYIEDIHVQEPTLEEIFLAYYGDNGQVSQQPARKQEQSVMEAV